MRSAVGALAFCGAPRALGAVATPVGRQRFRGPPEGPLRGGCGEMAAAVGVEMQSFASLCATRVLERVWRFLLTLSTIYSVHKPVGSHLKKKKT